MLIKDLPNTQMDPLFTAAGDQRRLQSHDVIQTCFDAGKITDVTKLRNQNERIIIYSRSKETNQLVLRELVISRLMGLLLFVVVLKDQEVQNGCW